MGLLSHKVEREEIKSGDHIYTWRAVFTYSHHGTLFSHQSFDFQCLILYKVCNFWLIFSAVIMGLGHFFDYPLIFLALFDLLL